MRGALFNVISTRRRDDELIRRTSQIVHGTDSDKHTALKIGLRNERLLEDRDVPRLAGILPPICICADIDRTSSSIYNDDSITILQVRIFQDTLFDGEVQTGLAFRNERDLCMPAFGVFNDPGVDCGLAHLRLLEPLPSIWMRENKCDVVLEGFPELSAIGVGVANIRHSALHQVTDEVAKDLDDRLVERQRWHFVRHTSAI